MMTRASGHRRGLISLREVGYRLCGKRHCVFPGHSGMGTVRRIRRLRAFAPSRLKLDKTIKRQGAKSTKDTRRILLRE